MGTRKKGAEREDSRPNTVPHALDSCAGRYCFVDRMPPDRKERRVERLDRREKERRIYEELRARYAAVEEADKIYDPKEER